MTNAKGFLHSLSSPLFTQEIACSIFDGFLVLILNECCNFHPVGLFYAGDIQN